jgi:hypothetical protein
MEITSRIVAFDRFWFLPVHSNGIRRQLLKKETLSIPDLRQKNSHESR